MAMDSGVVANRPVYLAIGQETLGHRGHAGDPDAHALRRALPDAEES